MKKYFKNITWESYDLPRALKERGVLDSNQLPGFHYRDDALRLWQAIKEYVTNIVSIYYASDEVIQKVCKVLVHYVFNRTSEALIVLWRCETYADCKA